jgi:hypothetical protein
VTRCSLQNMASTFFKTQEVFKILFCVFTVCKNDKEKRGNSRKKFGNRLIFANFRHIFTCVSTYIQRGSSFCFVVVVVVVVNLFLTLLKLLHYCPISPCFQHIAPLHAPLPVSLALQSCQAALPGNLVR